MRISEREFLGTIQGILDIYFDQVMREPHLNGGGIPDFLIVDKKGTLLVEFKLFRSKRIGISLLMRGVEQLLKYESDFGRTASKLLVVTCIVDEQQKASIAEQFGVVIWDIGTLLYLTAKNPTHRSQIEELLKLTTEFSEGSGFDGIVVPENFDVDYLWNAPKQSIPFKKPIQDQKNTLIVDIGNILSGKEDFSLFEKKCTEALKFIFRDHLSGWRLQNRTNDSLHRFDLVCRISSTYDYWKMLSSYFQSWYIVFEFKNYKDKITQEQVYSTEKYLFKTALRSIAFIISPKGCDSNALKAMEGALKEQGKLIVSLDVQELIEMIEIKDRGDEPTNFLIDKIDDILLSLSR